MKEEPMKKTMLIVLIASLLFCLVALCGCGKRIEGSCSQVVNECQSLKANEEATIVVTGRPRELAPQGSGVIFLSDNGVSGEPYVAVFFDDKSTTVSGRVTIEGELQPSMTHSDNISILHAKVKS